MSCDDKDGSDRPKEKFLDALEELQILGLVECAKKGDIDSARKLASIAKRCLPLILQVFQRITIDKSLIRNGRDLYDYFYSAFSEIENGVSPDVALNFSHSGPGHPKESLPKYHRDLLAAYRMHHSLNSDALSKNQAAEDAAAYLKDLGYKDLDARTCLRAYKKFFPTET